MSVEIEKKKRAANSPLAGSGKEMKEMKNSEQNQNGSPSLKDFHPLPNVSLPDLNSSMGFTYASVTSSGSALTTTTTTTTVSDHASRIVIDNSIFKTQKPQGGFRDEIVVEINTCSQQVSHYILSELVGRVAFDGVELA